MLCVICGLFMPALPLPLLEVPWVICLGCVDMLSMSLGTRIFWRLDFLDSLQEPSCQLVSRAFIFQVGFHFVPCKVLFDLLPLCGF